MGLMDKLKKSAGAADDYGEYDSDNGYYDEIGGDGYTDEILDDTTDNGGAYSAPAPSYASPRQSSTSISGSALEMKVVRPEHFDSVTEIAEHLLNHRTVVLNLENTNKETARRLIDFLSGVAFSINGSLKKIATSAYIITPDNVDVGDAKLKTTGDSDAGQPAERKQAPAGMSDEFSEF